MVIFYPLKLLPWIEPNHFMSSKSARDPLCNNNFFYQSMTATHLQDVFVCLIIQNDWLDCFSAVVMTDYNWPLHLKYIVKNCFGCLVVFMTSGGFQLRLNFGMINIHHMKKTFFQGDNDISPAILPNRGTSTGAFEPNCLSKSSVQWEFRPISSCPPDDPRKVTDHPEQSPTVF